MASRSPAMFVAKLHFTAAPFENVNWFGTNTAVAPCLHALMIVSPGPNRKKGIFLAT